LRKPGDYILLYFKGVGMGAADIVPGVSGGTVAFITGIYGTLVHSLSAFDGEAFRMLRKQQFEKFWTKVNGQFLSVVLAGIATSLFTVAKLMTWLLHHYPVYIRSFFFGLILISAPYALREIKSWSPGAVVAFLIGIAITYFLTRISPSITPDALWIVFLAGMLAINAMIIPGISGSFVLMLIGQYHFMLTALSGNDISTIAVFSAGCLIGLILFGRFLSALLDKYHNATVALLAGLMLGSLNKVWPWREVIEFVTSNKGLQIPVFDKSILPWHYTEITGKNPQILQAIVMMALGVLIVVLIEKIAVRLKTKI
jgi:putative membrane protein